MTQILRLYYQKATFIIEPPEHTTSSG